MFPRSLIATKSAFGARRGEKVRAQDVGDFATSPLSGLWSPAVEKVRAPDVGDLATSRGSSLDESRFGPHPYIGSCPVLSNAGHGCFW